MQLKILAIKLILLTGIGCLPTKSEAAESLRPGSYGFLTDYSAMDAAVAKSKIQVMVRDYGIRDFQFYDWFYDYSTPVQGDCWTGAFFRTRTICKRTILAYIEEIRAQGGTSWAYVQSVGSEHNDLENPLQQIFKLIAKDGTWYHHANRFPTYFANAAWAVHMVAEWAPEIKALGFDGIHWDSLGPIAGHYPSEAAGFHAFLRKAKVLLGDYGLKQTFNFVNLAWWDKSIVMAEVEFPYAEVWSRGIQEKYFRELEGLTPERGRPVVAFYPSIGRKPGESESLTMIDRWKNSWRNGARYLVVGDGTRRLINEYFPNSADVTSEEKIQLQAP